MVSYSNNFGDLQGIRDPPVFGNCTKNLRLEISIRVWGFRITGFEFTIWVLGSVTHFGLGCRAFKGLQLKGLVAQLGSLQDELAQVAAQSLFCLGTFLKYSLPVSHHAGLFQCWWVHILLPPSATSGVP